MLNRQLSRVGVRLQRASTIESLLRQSRVAAELMATMVDASTSGRNPSVAGVVFSMDRAIQLHALLATYARNVADSPRLHLLYRATTDAHGAAYREVIDEFGGLLASVTRQPARDTFRNQLLEILGGLAVDRLFFLVDDIVFIEPVDFGDLIPADPRSFVPSLRLGANLTSSYVVRQRQPLPALRSWPSRMPGGPELLRWRWSEGIHDWSYPLSVDGNVFARNEIVVLANHTSFDSPNSFENGLQQYAPFFQSRFGICYAKSRIVNIPWNRVQQEVANFHGSIHQDDLLREWQNGRRLDHEALQGFVNESVHQELPLQLRARR